MRRYLQRIVLPSPASRHAPPPHLDSSHRPSPHLEWQDLTLRLLVERVLPAEQKPTRLQSELSSEGMEISWPAIRHGCFHVFASVHCPGSVELMRELVQVHVHPTPGLLFFTWLPPDLACMCMCIPRLASFFHLAPS